MKISKRNTYIALASFAVIAVFIPGPEPTGRKLQAETGTPPKASGSYQYDDNEFEERGLQTSPTPPPAVTVSCAAGKQEWKVSWEADKFQAFTPEQVVTLTNGMQVTVKNYDTGASVTDQYSVLDTDKGQAIVFGTKTTIAQDAIIPSGGQPPFYPVDYGTMEIDFPEDIQDLYISVGDVDSTSKVSDCTRIRMFDATGNAIPLTFATTGTIKNVDDYAFESLPSKATSNPGYESSLYARANGAVRKIMLDQTSLAFEGTDMLGKSSRRGVFPALDFVYCADTPAPTPVPTLAPVTPVPTPEPSPGPTLAPISPSPTPDPTPGPTPAPTPPPSKTGKGVNGDPLIMGMAGQLFKFEGRNGAWYSYASASSFQWNMKVNQFEGCPGGSDKFTTGFGLTVFGDGPDGKNTRSLHNIEINVVNEHSTGTGCGFEPHKANDYGCLGAGSLEIMIDGHKVSRSIDTELKDGSGRVIAFNTISSCSRRWFDFEMTPVNEIGAISMLSPAATSTIRRRRLDERNTEGIFNVLDDLKDTTVNKDSCESWMAERKDRGDILEQAGTWSTIVIKTEKISFHVEYKQEQERCNAHNLDVWISEVSPDVLNENWEGIIGETKPMDYNDAIHIGTSHMSREEALKFPRDEDYEVIAPFSVDCHGCIVRGF
eukprot:CAMPEP_0202473872 /NCGR_PEP_ID=MMETSP1360-20130828/92077_1 /ASSEMBLY_ACC=CAM_ASM_000848 /TAXON_ID=515479 /ORGANISM="Licmophora paradoxa, Strain CCMP2313" /LENGTH=656 /DNA_ID=CAMNT_0049100955 /DNA_START=50 /DNA_END=2023 /DNA_ORIENTATION=-